MTSREGTITECKGANFMFVQGGRIKLPDRSNVLPGVSMYTVLELAETIGAPVDEGDYSPYDVYMADEAFISSTRYCMLPVATINGYPVGEALPGLLTSRFLDAWRETVGADFVRQALDHLPPEERSALLRDD
jgi:branched-chain amino acid aminotransferase